MAGLIIMSSSAVILQQDAGQTDVP